MVEGFPVELTTKRLDEQKAGFYFVVFIIGGVQLVDRAYEAVKISCLKKLVD
jgi:hypothetical protein